MLYLDDFSKPSDFVASVKVNKGRNMDPYSFAFSASGKMKYGGVVKNPKFPGKSSFILLELETPIKRSVPCHEINRDADVPQPAVGLPVFIDPVHEPAQGLPLPAFER
jgi:hypothetical protein